MKKIVLSIICGFAMQANIQAQLIKNDFMDGISVGAPIESATYSTQSDPIEVNKWHVASFLNMQGASPLAVSPLTYEGYAESGKSNAFEMLMLTEAGNSTSRLTGYSLTDKGTYKSGVYYVAFMLNVSSTMWTGHANAKAFFMLNGSHTSAFKRVACYVNKVNTTKLQLGLLETDTDFSATNSEVIFTAKEVDFGQTHLVVLKYDFSTKRADLFLNPTLQETEPASDVFIENVSEDFNTAGIRAITVRQRRNTSQKIGGIRFAKTWADAIGYENGTSIENADADNKTVIKEEFYTLTGVKVNNIDNKGCYIKKAIFEDGTMKTDKVYQQ